MEILVTWREMLGRIIHDISERQRIVEILGVSPVTLMRWANNTSSPRPQNLHHLLEALPEYRNRLLELILEEFPDFITTPNEEPAEYWGEIPSSFYTRAIHAFATTPKTQRFWAMSNLFLQQALEHLDPDRLGLALTIVQCRKTIFPPFAARCLRITLNC